MRRAISLPSSRHARGNRSPWATTAPRAGTRSPRFMACRWTGGCNELTGRFEILDISIASDGTVQRFAADFEQHCEDAVAGQFGAIRYNSLAGGTIVPFGGAYPSYQLAVTPAAHGRVSGTDSELRRRGHRMSADAAGGRADYADRDARLRLHVHGLDRGLQRRHDHDAACEWTEAVWSDLRADRSRGAADAPRLGRSAGELHRLGPARSALAREQSLVDRITAERQRRLNSSPERGSDVGFLLGPAFSAPVPDSSSSPASTRPE